MYQSIRQMYQTWFTVMSSWFTRTECRKAMCLYSWFVAVLFIMYYSR